VIRGKWHFWSRCSSSKTHRARRMTYNGGKHWKSAKNSNATVCRLSSVPTQQQLTQPHILADDALLQYAHVEHLERPVSRHVEVLREWLDRPEGGDFFLRGREAEIWDKDKDLIAPASRESDKDSLTLWITDTLIPWYHCRWGYRIKVSIGYRIPLLQF